MIRLFFEILYVIVFVVLSIPILLIEWILGKFAPRAQQISSFRIAQGVCWCFLFIAGALPEVKGKENIPSDTPVLYVANHRSIFDILLTLALSPAPTCYIAKIEIRKVPILYHWFVLLKGEFLDRKDLKQGMQVIRNAAEKVGEGMSVFIFPEGTRSKGPDETELLEFHEGSFRIAVRSGCPVVPISISNSRNIFEAQFPWIKKSHVVVEYGEPVVTKGLDRQAQKTRGVRCRSIISETLKKNAAVSQKN